MVLVETIVGGLLSSFLPVLFERLASRQLIDFLSGDALDINRLKRALLTINAVLVDAEEKQIINKFVKEWVDELKDVAYQAEDLLDCISTLASQPSLLQSLTNYRPDLISKLKTITSKLEDLAELKDVLGLKESPGGKLSPRLPTTSLVDESEVYGREKDKEKIMEFLLAGSTGEKEIPVIAIIGTGGVGKTTLAQLLYNDSRAKEHFDKRVWVYVSEDFDVFKLTKTIFESVTLQPCKITNLNAIQVVLTERLATKKFLLVLDDVWNQSFIDWEVFQSSFKVGASESRIIVTTRSQGVATTMYAALTHSLNLLSYEDCCKIFEKYAFRRKNIHAHSNLRIIGGKIVKKCEGLPLAAKTLGSLLHDKEEEDEWIRILDSKIWDLPNDKSNILPSLRLSYYYLPSHLKQCFAYCSIFPKGYAFEREKLLLLWMAEGFLSTSSDRRIQEVGHEYFVELVSRSFFQQAIDNGSRFKMHDLVNELAQFVSGDFCFKFEGGNPRCIPEKARHFSYVMEQVDLSQKFEALQKVEYLRTFLPLSLSLHSPSASCRPLNKGVIGSLLSTLRCLRVLSLSHYRITELPDKFGKLQHLRHLDLSYTAIRKLPESTCDLYNLQILILSNCSQLIELPAKTRKLIKLVHLDLARTNSLKEMPPKLDRLKSLQTLTKFVVSKSNRSSISELGGLPHLHGKLSILKLENVRDAATAGNAKLKEKKNIKELVLSWDNHDHGLRNEIDVLGELRPHENIENLTIERYGDREFPKWLGDPSFSKMVILRLNDCINCSSLSSLGQLSSLKELYVSNMRLLESIGLEFYGNESTAINGFESLRIMVFKNMPKWKRWSYFAVNDGGFPSLRKLHIEKCPELTGNLPTFLSSLTELYIDDCRKLQLQSEDMRHYTELHTLQLKSSCDALMEFQLGYFNKLQKLEIHNCRNLKFIKVSDEHDQELVCLQEMVISECCSLEAISGTGLPAPNLLSF